jgi:hypothetical protein
MLDHLNPVELGDAGLGDHFQRFAGGIREQMEVKAHQRFLSWRLKALRSPANAGVQIEPWTWTPAFAGERRTAWPKSSWIAQTLPEICLWKTMGRALPQDGA